MPTHIRRLTNRLGEADNRSRIRCSGSAKPTTGSAGSRLAVENNRLLSTGSNLPQDPAFTGIFYMAERERLTRAFGPRPAGDACASSKIAFGDFVEPPFPYLGFESPLRRYRGQLIQSDEYLHSDWRRGRDSNPRWAFDPYALSRGAPSTTRPPLREQTAIRGARDDTRPEQSR
jgi:hypothetical protein